MLLLSSALAGACTQSEVLGDYPASLDQGSKDSGVSPPKDEPSVHRGEVLVVEGFDDGEWIERGWYDDPAGTIVEGVSGGAFECIMSGAEPCERPGRIAFPPQDTVYVSYWIRFSAEYELEQEVVQLFILTDVDRQYIGPAISSLTVTFSQLGERAQVGLIDSANVDLDCVLLNDGSFQGCDGSFEDYQFTEARSVNACNGIVGNPTQTSCSPNDFGGFYSFRGFASEREAFTDAPGAAFKGDWHFVEALVELNSVRAGVGQSDGRLRYWFDGDKLIDVPNLILRTGEHPDMSFQHILVAPIRIDSELDQRLFMDELTVAQGVP